MYAELDAADRIGWSTDGEPFSRMHDAVESPASPQRAIDTFTMNRAYFESRFYDDAYWEKYFSMLARDRFNMFFLTFGYENGGFLAPCYPYFFDTEGFPDVKMVGITATEQKKNLDTLNHLIDMAHAHGLQVTLGVWNHIFRGGVESNSAPGAAQALRQPTPGWTWGLTGDNLVPYTEAALAKLIKVVPKMDGIQFRMHDEGGLRLEEQANFWKHTFALVHETAPNLRIDIRAKGLPDSTIQDAVDAKLNVRVSTKIWMEQMGLPYNPTHINKQDQSNRRHGYADLLHYPQQYAMTWGLWNGGTSRVFVWVDPDYARRLVEATHIYPGKGDGGFDMDEPSPPKCRPRPRMPKSFPS